MIGIQNIAYSFADDNIMADQLAERYGFDLEFIKDKLGIESLYKCSPKQTASDLAYDACQKLLEALSLETDAIEFLCLVTQTADYQLPHTAAIVHDRLKLKLSVPTFDINLGCSGYVYGLSIINGFMQSQGLTNGILVTVDCYSKFIDPSDRATAPLFSDAATATLLSHTPRYLFGKFSFGTDGSGAKNLIIDRGSKSPDSLNKLYMNGRAIFNFMMRHVVEDIKNCLIINNSTVESVDLFIFHQANKFMLESLMQSLNLPKDKVCFNVKQGGNTVSSSIPIALATVFKNRPKRILISGFGVGLSWASSILELA